MIEKGVLECEWFSDYRMMQIIGVKSKKREFTRALCGICIA